MNNTYLILFTISVTMTMWNEKHYLALLSGFVHVNSSATVIKAKKKKTKY